MFWEVKVVSTYAVIPAENINMHFNHIFQACNGDYTRNDLITCNLIRIIPGILEGKSNEKYTC